MYNLFLNLAEKLPCCKPLSFAPITSKGKDDISVWSKSATVSKYFFVVYLIPKILVSPKSALVVPFSPKGKSFLDKSSYSTIKKTKKIDLKLNQTKIKRIKKNQQKCF